MGTFDQSEWAVRFEWGLQGVEVLAPISEVVVIVDVLRFTTATCVGVERGATIYPYPWKDSSVHEYAAQFEARVASSDSIYSLSPKSMETITPGTRLVLPSPNGSTLSFAAASLTNHVLAGCLRNAEAVARASDRTGRSVTIIASGERWKSTNELRPAIEDMLGAGAIISNLSGSKSPEARIAESAFVSHRHDLEAVLIDSASGREVIERGCQADVEFAAALDSSTAVPVLRDRAFVKADS